MERYMTTVHRLFAVFLLTAAATTAEPIYVNGLPNTGSGNEATSRVQAEDFTLNESMTLTGVRF